MIKMDQISENHPALEGIKGVKKYCGDKLMEYPLPEVVLISPGRRGGGSSSQWKPVLLKPQHGKKKIPVLTGHRTR